MIVGLLLAFVAYLCGSIPWGLVLGRWAKGIDIRQHGSGNIGATNAWRVLGARWGLLVFALDLAKGIFPVAALPSLLPGELLSHAQDWQVGFGVMTVLGHMYPCWLGFRGGKGVATALGVVAVLAWLSTSIAAVTFGLGFALSRIVSLSSILAALAFLISQVIQLSLADGWQSSIGLAIFSVGMPLLIIARHRGNIVRLWRGEEHRFSKRPEATASNNESSPAESAPRQR